MASNAMAEAVVRSITAATTSSFFRPANIWPKLTSVTSIAPFVFWKEPYINRISRH